MAQLFWPLDPSTINYGFGYPPGYGGFHNGIDFPVTQGTPLKATASGVVRNNDAGAKDGAGVDIRTPDGWLVRMWHVSKFLVPNGSRVNAGDIVALSGGARGTWGAGNSTGPHLHWGVQINGTWVDPAPLVSGKIDNKISNEGNEMRLVAGFPSNRRFALGELTYQELPMDQASHSAHIWESAPGGKATGEPLVVDDADLDLEIGQIQKRRAQLAEAFKFLGV